MTTHMKNPTPDCVMNHGQNVSILNTPWKGSVLLKTEYIQIPLPPQLEALLVPRALDKRHSTHWTCDRFWHMCLCYLNTASSSQAPLSFCLTRGLGLRERANAKQGAAWYQLPVTLVIWWMNGIDVLWGSLSQDSIRGILANKHYLFIEKCSQTYT